MRVSLAKLQYPIGDVQFDRIIGIFSDHGNINEQIAEAIKGVKPLIATDQFIERTDPYDVGDTIERVYTTVKYHPLNVDDTHIPAKDLVRVLITEYGLDNVQAHDPNQKPNEAWQCAIDSHNQGDTCIEVFENADLEAIAIDHPEVAQDMRIGLSMAWTLPDED